MDWGDKEGTGHRVVADPCESQPAESSPDLSLHSTLYSVEGVDNFFFLEWQFEHPGFCWAHFMGADVTYMITFVGDTGHRAVVSTFLSKVLLSENISNQRAATSCPFIWFFHVT